MPSPEQARRRRTSARPGVCAFCNASRPVVTTAVIDEKWSRRFGGPAVVTLDHGWYRGPAGERTAADLPGAQQHFRPAVRALCDFCDNGWAEDVRWRAEPQLLSIAEGRRELPLDAGPLLRWLRFTALLADLMDRIPSAATPAQRDAVRRPGEPDLPLDAWVFTTRQRSPTRVHLSQVALGCTESFLQVVSVELAHFTGLVVIPSGTEAAAVVRRSQIDASLGDPNAARPAMTRLLDLAVTPRPHRVAVHRLCTSSETGVADR